MQGSLNLILKTIIFQHIFQFPELFREFLRL